MDLPNLCVKAANSDVNSDLDCGSDVDFDCDSQNKLHADEKFTTQKLKKLFFTRVSTDSTVSTETDCSFKSQPNDGSSNSIGELQNAPDNIPDNKSDSMECDSSKKLPSSDGFCIVQNVVSSTVDIDVIAGGKEQKQQPQPQQQQLEHCSLDDHTNKTVADDVIAICVPNDDNDIVCGSVSVADVVIDPNIPIETESIENSI